MSFLSVLSEFLSVICVNTDVTFFSLMTGDHCSFNVYFLQEN